MTSGGVRLRPALPRHEVRSQRLLAALHARDRRSHAVAVRHERLLLRAYHCDAESRL